ncbi:alpha/beta fold hydrolase [Acidimangrovimonas pyrenivorans]|uniref:Alpha/beta fold hydrolase n=1 Tax=Acidimangrovimonas pyrenivorans TaxID=2030798 RepID=A0ABV7AEF9_9RHOB
MALMHVNGAALFVEEFGAGEEVVLFTHALFFSGRMYERQIQRLADRYRCITIDWRGMGRSGKPLGGYDVDNLCHDVIGVADALGIDRFHWVGMSVGGVVGIRLAAQMPARFKSLAIGGASAEAEPIEKVMKYENLLLDGYAVDPASVVDGLMPILYGEPFRTDPARADDVARERARIIDNDGPAVARASAPILRRVDIRHMLPHVACPTYVFVGELDGANPPAKSRIIAEGIRDSKLEIFDGLGHQPNAEAPELLADRLRAHLDAVAG